MNIQRIFLLVKFDILNAVFRLKGLLFLIPYLFYWYCIIWFFIKKGTAFLVSPESIILTSVVFDQEIAQKLLIQNPAAISMFLLLSIASMPFFVMLAGNDQLASDSGRRSMRYLLIRSTRMELYFARFLSAFLLMAVLILIISLVMAVISYYHDTYSATQTLLYWFQVCSIVLLYSLPFFAFMSIVSAFMSSALGTLLMAFVIYIGLLILDYNLGLNFSLLPSGIKQELLLVNTNNILKIAVFLMTYTFVYLLSGWLLFKRRNI